MTSFEMDFRGKCDWINILYMSTPPVFYLTSSTNIEQFFWQESGLNWMFIIRNVKKCNSLLVFHDCVKNFIHFALKIHCWICVIGKDKRTGLVQIQRWKEIFVKIYCSGAIFVTKEICGHIRLYTVTVFPRL